MIDFKDKVLVCQDCGREFVWTAGEQAYYHSKDLSEPKRCKQCRLRRRRTIVTETQLRQLGGNDGNTR